MDVLTYSSFAADAKPKMVNGKIVWALSNDIMFNDFKNCASFLTDIIFFEYRIINDDRSVVSLDKILEMIPNIKSCLFYYDFHMIQDATMKNICQLKNLQNLDLFVVANIPEVVNVGDLSTFIKYHADTKIKFSFNDEISDGYKVQLDALIDTIITSEAPHCLIEYFGQKKEKFNIMHKNYLF
uniref:Uncharacterized protein n=1 Tax=Panagrolaimus superbus TaxID=310955 RepID=A0A914Z8P8_9BILA